MCLCPFCVLSMVLAVPSWTAVAFERGIVLCPTQPISSNQPATLIHAQDWLAELCTARTRSLSRLLSRVCMHAGHRPSWLYASSDSCCLDPFVEGSSCQPFLETHMHACVNARQCGLRSGRLGCMDMLTWWCCIIVTVRSSGRLRAAQLLFWCACDNQ